MRLDICALFVLLTFYFKSQKSNGQFCPILWWRLLHEIRERRNVKPQRQRAMHRWCSLMAILPAVYMHKSGTDTWSWLVASMRKLCAQGSRQRLLPISWRVQNDFFICNAIWTVKCKGSAPIARFFAVVYVTHRRHRVEAAAATTAA